jgi:hypothetical protein
MKTLWVLIRPVDVSRVRIKEMKLSIKRNSSTFSKGIHKLPKEQIADRLRKIQVAKRLTNVWRKKHVQLPCIIRIQRWWKKRLLLRPSNDVDPITLETWTEFIGNVFCRVNSYGVMYWYCADSLFTYLHTKCCPDEPICRDTLSPIELSRLDSLVSSHLLETYGTSRCLLSESTKRMLADMKESYETVAYMQDTIIDNMKLLLFHSASANINLNLPPDVLMSSGDFQELQEHFASLHNLILQFAHYDKHECIDFCLTKLKETRVQKLSKENYMYYLCLNWLLNGQGGGQI